MFPPPDSWDPPVVSSHGRKCLLVMQKILFLPLTAGTHQIWWLTCGPTKWVYAGLCQLNQQMILAAGPLDVNPTAVLLLQPLFLLMSPVGGTAAMLPRTRTSQVSHSSPSATPLPCLPHLRVVPVWGLAILRRPWCTRHSVVTLVNNQESSEDDCT